jgi:hypothetical protein
MATHAAIKSSFIIMICVSMCIKLCTAQTLSTSAELNERGFDYVKVMGQTEKGFYALYSNFPIASNRNKVGFKVRKYKAAFYDFNMKSKWTIPIEIPDHLTLENITFACQKILLTYSAETANNTRKYQFQWIEENGSLQSVNKSFELTLKKGSSADKIEVSTSLNRKQLLFLLHEITNDNSQIFHLAGTDSSLIMQQIKTLEVPHKTSIFYSTRV